MRTKSSNEPKTGRKSFQFKKKYCYFCKERITFIDFKDYKVLENFTTDSGKIQAARVTGTCPTHQKQLAKAIKRARHMALLKFVETK